MNFKQNLNKIYNLHWRRGLEETAVATSLWDGFRCREHRWKHVTMVDT